MVELELLHHSLGIEVFQVFEIFRAGFLLLNVLDLGNQVIGLHFFIRLLVFFFLVAVQSATGLLLSLKGHLFEEAFDLIVVMLPEIIFIALDFHIELLDADFLWFLDFGLGHFCALHLHIGLLDVLALLDLLVHLT